MEQNSLKYWWFVCRASVSWTLLSDQLQLFNHWISDQICCKQPVSWLNSVWSLYLVPIEVTWTMGWKAIFPCGIQIIRKKNWEMREGVWLCTLKGSVDHFTMVVNRTHVCLKDSGGLRKRLANIVQWYNKAQCWKCHHKHLIETEKKSNSPNIKYI